MQTRHGVLGDASWNRGSVKGTNAAHEKPCQQIRAPKLEHAAWQDGARTPFPGTARTCRGASSPRKVDGTRAKDLWCVPAGFSQGPVYKSRPGLFIRLGQIGVLGSAGWVHGLGGTAGQNHSSQSRSPTHTAVPRPTKQPVPFEAGLSHEADRRLTQAVPRPIKQPVPFEAGLSHTSRSQTDKAASCFRGGPFSRSRSQTPH